MNSIKAQYLSSRLLHQAREHSIYRLLYFNPNHIWLASFPRSGNTWLRLMMHELLLNEPSDRNKIRLSIPDIHNKWDIFNLNQAKTHFVKTHFPYRKYCKNIIYIIRNPLDVIYSYWNLETKVNQSPLSLEEIIYRETQFGGIYGRWDKHIISYLDSNLSPSHLLLIYYENLILEPLTILQKIINFCGLEYSQDKIQKAIMSSVDNFLINTDYLSNDKSYEEKKQYIFNTQVGKGLKHLNHDQVERILDSPIGTTAIALGYF